MARFSYLKRPKMWWPLLAATLVGIIVHWFFAWREPESEPIIKTVYQAPWQTLPPRLALAFSPDNALLFATCPDYNPYLRGTQFIDRPFKSWVLVVRDGLCPLLPLTDTMGSCVFSTRGEKFAIYDNHSCNLFDSRTGKKLANLASKIDRPFLGLCFDADDRMLGVGSLQPGAIVRELNSNKVCWRLEGKHRWSGGVFDHYFNILSEDGHTTEIWDILTGNLVVAFDVGGLRKLGAIGGGIYCCYSDDLDFYDLRAGRKHYVRLQDRPATTHWPATGDTSIALRVTEEQRDIEKLTQDPGVKFYDVLTGNELGYLPEALCAVVSRDRTKIAFAKGQSELELWELPERKRWGAAGPATAVLALFVIVIVSNLRRAIIGRGAK
jgi:hypothetical protein